MNERHTLFQVLKRELKARQITYRALAEHLRISEASVKRLFQQQNMSLQRLEAVAALLGLQLVELLQMSQQQVDYISQLTPEQEQQLVTQPKLLLLTFLLLNHWPLVEITEVFAIDQYELTTLLAKLDQLKLIELLPNNRVKLLTARNFSWRQDGPIQAFFRRIIQAEFFASNFHAEHEKLHFLSGTLSTAAYQKYCQKLQQLARDFDELVQADTNLPLTERNGYSLVLAIRHWEPKLFTELRREG